MARFYIKPEFTKLPAEIAGNMGPLAIDLMLHHYTLGPDYPILFPKGRCDLPRKALLARGIRLITRKKGKGMLVWTETVA
jgi:hypothetical protein